METIDVALAADRHYFCGLLVTAASLARFASRDVALRFDILDGGLSEGDWGKLVTTVSREHPHAECRRFRVDDSRFSAFPEWNGPSRMTYARLLLPELVMDATHILYCDVDFLWTVDVAELWAMRDDTTCVLAHLDGPVTRNDVEPAWFRARGLRYDPERYVCAGLLLINLSRFRAENMSGKMMDFLHAHPDVKFVDQTAINAVLMQSDDAGLLRLMPDRFHRFAWSMKPAEVKGAWAIHYGGDSPWRRDWWTQLLDDAVLLWHRYHGEWTGRSRWRSLRQFYTARDILTRRFLYKMLQVAPTRMLFFLLLRLCGRGCYVDVLKRRMGLE